MLSPGWTFGIRYCQKKHPVITSDNMRKNTKPSWVHFTFILLVLVCPSNLTAAAAAAAGGATAGVGLCTDRQGTHEHSKLALNVSVCYLTPSNLHSFSCFWSLTHRDKILSLTLTSVVQHVRNPLVNM